MDLSNKKLQKMADAPVGARYRVVETDGHSFAKGSIITRADKGGIVLGRYVWFDGVAKNGPNKGTTIQQVMQAEQVEVVGETQTCERKPIKATTASKTVVQSQHVAKRADHIWVVEYKNPKVKQRVGVLTFTQNDTRKKARADKNRAKALGYQEVKIVQYTRGAVIR